ncbi:MAG: hypothetical protein QM754_15055 [Tepidisphaeraceae bacterium]
MLQIPQPADDDVPVGKDASDNVVVRHVGEKPKFDFTPKGHTELAEALGSSILTPASAWRAAESTCCCGALADLHQAVLRFAVDLMTNQHGFTQVTCRCSSAKKQ